MTRRQLRDHLFKELFFLCFYPEEEWPVQVDYYLAECGEVEEKERAALSELPMVISRKCEELDARINEVSGNWKTGRMSQVDLTIIRLALYEMLYMEEIPKKVSINEAVELAKLYGGSESPSFVNGVLAKLIVLDP